MKTFTFKGDRFFADDKKVFLTSGEIHYWRIRRELWTKHLQAAREAGLTTVSTYIPWAWHESEEGVFDFGGDSVPERDLIAWLGLCQEYGLHCVVKPGPFILAEFRGAGLPDWFLEKYGSMVKMRNSRGEIVPSDGVSLFHDIYLEKVRLWYDRIMPFIAERQLANGGPVIMMQICNEIGVFTWLANQADYQPAVRELFIPYLKKRYANIDQLNRDWGTTYPSFAEVLLPPDGKQPCTSRGDRAMDIEWHRFWRSYYGDYLRMLTAMARERGVSVPLYHNLPGWIYGSGYEFPVNITMYEDLFRDRSEIIFGVDHIPEFLSYRNLHDDRIINDITMAMQGSKPLFAAEFQSGSREFHVETNPREMELFYKASIANGLMGWNYYMFSQGKNARRTGYSGDTFYWYCPLNSEGEKGTAFPLVQKMNRLIRTSEEVIVEARRKAEVCVLFYPPYYATEIERPAGKGSELRFVPSAIRRSAYFDGLLKALQVLNIDYDMADLSKISASDMDSYRQVWVFSTDEMDARDQQVVVDYVKGGGDVVLYPYLPDRELSQQPCTVIRDALQLAPAGFESVDSPLVDIFAHADIKCSNPQVVYSPEDLGDAGIIARTINGSVCGFSKKLGKGNLLHLGTWIGFDTEGHKAVYRSFLEQSGARLSNTGSGNDHIAIRQRFTGKDSALLFIGNYYNEAHSARLSYTHPQSGEQIFIPYLEGEMRWPALYAVISPVNMELQKELRLLHTTSDLLGIEHKEGRIMLSLCGERDLKGELVLEGKEVNRIKAIRLNGKVLSPLKEAQRLVLNYDHAGGEEFVLELELSE